MLYIALNAKTDKLNQQLIHRPWLLRQPLSSIISITPRLSEDAPLWLRDDKSLSALKIADFNPEELKEKVYAYWAKAAWKRWLLRLWAGPSYQAIDAWYYLQDCLAFREIVQSLPPENPDLALVTSSEQRIQGNEQKLLESLGEWFAQQEENFQQSLKTRSILWLHKNFPRQLSRYEKLRSEKFLKQLKKEMHKFPGDANQEKEAQDKALIN